MAVERLEWANVGETDPPKSTGDWEAEDSVDAYSYHYAHEKRHLFEWSKVRMAPPWLEEYTVASAEEA